MKKFLLHVCCAPCAAYIFEELKERGFEVTAFYYNPNIFPEEEYKIRKNEAEKYCKEKGINLIVEDRLETVEDCVSLGMKAILINRPWNQKENLDQGIKRVEGWKEILEILKNAN